MSSASNYWQLVKLEATGKRRIETMPNAKTYFYDHFSSWAEQSSSPGASVQIELWHRYQQGEAVAELCLRCYISHQIDQACRDLSLRFGTDHGFTCEDVLPLVLDDVGRSIRSPNSTATAVLKAFSPSKGSLNAWIHRLVRQHPEMRRFLLQHGVYLVSDWALLNDTTPKRLNAILTEIYPLTPIEIKEACELLETFHVIYREARLQQRLQSGKNQLCQPPTGAQLNQMTLELSSRIGKTIPPETILKQLSAIAAKVRRCRMVAQGGKIDSVSIDQPEYQSIGDRAQALDPADEHSEFLAFYQTQFLECLDQAIAHSIGVALKRLQQKRSASDQAFLTAIHLLHCQGQSMAEIAPQIGLKKQYEVTRLLTLTDLRADIRQRSLLLLRDRVIDKAKLYATIETLQQLDQRVEQVLNEQISNVIEEAESEAKSPVRNQPFRSLFARRLCLYLASRKP